MARRLRFDLTRRQILQGLGKTADAVAGALVSVYNDAAQAVTGVLKGVGYAIDDVAAALQNVFSGISVDPANNSFWAANEIANGSSNKWDTRLANFSPANTRRTAASHAAWAVAPARICSTMKKLPQTRLISSPIPVPPPAPAVLST